MEGNPNDRGLYLLVFVDSNTGVPERLVKEEDICVRGLLEPSPIASPFCEDSPSSQAPASCPDSITDSAAADDDTSAVTHLEKPPKRQKRSQRQPSISAILAALDRRPFCDHCGATGVWGWPVEELERDDEDWGMGAGDENVDTLFKKNFHRREKE